MEENNKFLGFFFKIGFDSNLNEQDSMNLANMFRLYIWGEKGISNILKRINHEDYGKDLVLILFEFNVKPTSIELEAIKEIGSYRKKEKSIGIPIIVNDENFFNQSEEERYNFLKQAIFHKLDLLAEVIKKKKLDTNIELLKSDLENIFKAI